MRYLTLIAIALVAMILVAGCTTKATVSAKNTPVTDKPTISYDGYTCIAKYETYQRPCTTPEAGDARLGYA